MTDAVQRLSGAHRHMRILDVRIDDVNTAEALEHIRQCMQEPGLHQIATVNPEFVVLAQKNVAFRHVLNETSLNVPDGVGLLWAARRIGQPFRERVAGQELVDGIAEVAARQGWRIFLLGAREGIAAKAAAVLSDRHKNLQVAGCYSGSPSTEEEQHICNLINGATTDILLVAYGPPKQDLWIARNTSRLRAHVALGVGGTFDTLAGIVPRAPAWVRRAGFEWTWRLLREPRRLRRQLAIPLFMWLIVTAQKTSRSD